jgi:hypothetical protein
MGDSKRWQRIRSPAATGARETKPANDATSDRGRRFTLSFGELSALIATVGGLTYLLGLFVFALPIKRVYPVDFTEAWYATSLVPKTLVAGQGATRMLGWPLYVGVSILVSFALLDLAFFNYQFVVALWREVKSARFLMIMVAALGVLSTLFFYLFEGSFLGSAIVGLGALLMFILGLRELRLFYQGRSLEFNLLTGRSYIPGRSYPISWGFALYTVIITFLLQFALQAVEVAQKTDPPLPRVEITWTADASNSTKATLTEGKLLTHTESFWYVLKKDGQDAGLSAIPDDKVQHVRIGPPAKKYGE